MKHTISKLIVPVIALILCVLTLIFFVISIRSVEDKEGESKEKAGANAVEDIVSGEDSASAKKPGKRTRTRSSAANPAGPVANSAASPAGNASSAANGASDTGTVSAGPAAGSNVSAGVAGDQPGSVPDPLSANPAGPVPDAGIPSGGETVAAIPSGTLPGADPGAGEIIPEEEEEEELPVDDSYVYFEYQVITVPKRTLEAAAASLGLPRESRPSNELLPAIYRQGGYRVIGYSAGYAASRSPAEFKMTRAERFPDFYILPQSAKDLPVDKSDKSDPDDSGDIIADAGNGGDDFISVPNNLASILPFFGSPTITGNEFFFDTRALQIFILESNLRKLSGFVNTDYGPWGTGQSPVFEDNSFADTLPATNGKPMIVSMSQADSNVWTLHVFFTQPQPMPEDLTPAAGTDKKMVRLEFQIARVNWNGICAAGNSDGCPSLPSENLFWRLSSNGQMRDIYSPTFRLIPSRNPVTLQPVSKTQFVPLNWVPAQDPGIPAIPLNSSSIWTGTSLRAAARILDEGKTVRLDYSFEKSSQTIWHNYDYSYYGEPSQQAQDRYAHPQRRNEPEILDGILRLPVVDTTSFRQTLYLEVGKPVLAARISNPAYQPDMLTLVFVTATVEDAQ